MASKSKIEWCDSTWTPIQAVRKDTGKRGVACVKVSPACQNCYSERFNMRGLPSHGTGLPFTVQAMEQVDIVVNEEILLQPLRWKKPRRIFVCSQTDLFGEFVPTEMIDRVFAVMALCPQHTFLVLTKRAQRMRKYVTTEFVCNRIFDEMRALTPSAGVWNWGGMTEMFRHIWLGVTAENQACADERIPDLRKTPAAKRFVSVEPILGPMTIDILGIDWVICGGESGPGARLTELQWAMDLRNQCASAGVAFFMKQITANGKKVDYDEWPEELKMREFPQ